MGRVPSAETWHTKRDPIAAGHAQPLRWSFSPRGLQDSLYRFAGDDVPVPNRPCFQLCTREHLHTTAAHNGRNRCMAEHQNLGPASQKPLCIRLPPDLGRSSDTRLFLEEVHPGDLDGKLIMDIVKKRS